MCAVRASGARAQFHKAAHSQQARFTYPNRDLALSIRPRNDAPPRFQTRETQHNSPPHPAFTDPHLHFLASA